MPIASGLLTLAMIGGGGGDGAPAAAEASPTIVYEVKVIETKGLGWRGRARDRLTAVARRGQATVWTADASVLKELSAGADRVIEPPKVRAAADASASIAHEDVRNYVSDLHRVADAPPNRATAVAYQPTIDRVGDRVECSVRGRVIDQGTLATVAVEDRRVSAIHSYSIGEDVASPSGPPTHLNASIQVPEIASCRVDGEWLIPRDGVLIVSTGPHTKAGLLNRAVSGERLILIEAHAQKSDPAVEKVRFPLPVRVAPPVAVGTSSLPMVVAPVAEEAGPLTTPPTPSRAMPTGRDADGRVVDLPPLPEEPAEVPSAEPRPSSQVRPVRPTPSSTAPTPGPEKAPGFARVGSSAPGDPAVTPAASVSAGPADCPNCAGDACDEADAAACALVRDCFAAVFGQGMIAGRAGEVATASPVGDAVRRVRFGKNVTLEIRFVESSTPGAARR